jgi:hypothetical protein
MSIIHFPKLSNNIWKHINCVIDIEPPTIYISFSLFHFLSEITIKKNELYEQWFDAAVITDEHEPILNLDSPLNISIYKPISNLYFKIIEVIQSVRFNFKDFKPTNFVMFSFGKTPCEFIEPFYKFRKNNNDKYYGFSSSNEKNCYKTTEFLNKSSNVFLSNENQTIKSLNDKYKNSVDLIFCEGGSEYDPEFIRSEQLFIEISKALCVQANGGSLIVKLFDCFHKTTSDIVYVLSSMYEKTYIIKPHISRQMSPERFLVCNNFLLSDCKDYSNIFEKNIQLICNKNKTQYISSFLEINQTPIFFKNKMIESNTIIGQQQLENIYNIFGIIENKYKCDYNIKTNFKTSTLWCDKYGIDIKPDDKSDNKVNIFRQSNI